MLVQLRGVGYGSEEVKYDPPHKILDQLEALEAEITADLKELRGML